MGRGWPECGARRWRRLGGATVRGAPCNRGRRKQGSGTARLLPLREAVAVRRRRRAVTQRQNRGSAEAESSLLRGDSRHAGVGVGGCGLGDAPGPEVKLRRRLAVAGVRRSSRSTAVRRSSELRSVARAALAFWACVARRLRVQGSHGGTYRAAAVNLGGHARRIEARKSQRSRSVRASRRGR